MLPLDITAIDQHARHLRAADMQRNPERMSAQMHLYGQLLAASLLTGLIALSEVVRPLFSWNPQAAFSRRHAPQP
jgi:hypothetical protein